MINNIKELLGGSIDESYKAQKKEGQIVFDKLLIPDMGLRNGFQKPFDTCNTPKICLTDKMI